MSRDFFELLVIFSLCLVPIDNLLGRDLNILDGLVNALGGLVGILVRLAGMVDILEGLGLDGIVEQLSQRVRRIRPGGGP